VSSANKRRIDGRLPQNGQAASLRYYRNMNLQLEGKKALVTGSTAGIGLAIATALAKEGADVVVNGRTQQRVDEALRKTGARHGIAADLAAKRECALWLSAFPFWTSW
jgi:NADP-dependent 3-hydroxy acid dehydrogenase YdfG